MIGLASSPRWGAAKVGSSGWQDDIDPLGETKCFPDGVRYQSLSITSARILADRHNIPMRDVEVEALKQNVLPERYARNRRILSMADQIQLLSSSVAVVGVGGLGGSVAEILARLGVGRLVLIDGDTFETSNLNRQLFSTIDLLGQPKVEVARARIVAINDTVLVTTHQQFLDPTNASDLLGNPDVVIDCLDTVPSRFALQKVAGKMGAPMVSAAIAGLMGQMTTVLPKDPGLSLVYGKEEEAPPQGVERVLGNLAPMVMQMASLQCMEAIKIILKRPDILRHRLLLVDLERYTMDTMMLSD